MEKLNIGFEAAIAICLGARFLCDCVSLKSKSRIPSMLLMAILFLIGYWTILPTDIVQTAKFDQIYLVAMAAMMVQIGSTFDFEQLKRDWRVVAITLIALLAMGLSVWFICGAIFSRDTAVAAIPIIAGGAVAANLMIDAASAAGLTELAVLVAMIQAFQSLVGMPIMNWALSHEARTLIQNYRNGIVIETAATEKNKDGKVRLCDRIPKRYKSSTYYLFVSFLVGAIAAWLATYTGALTNGYVNSTILCVILGIVLSHFGILEKDPWTKSGAYGFLMACASFNLITNLGGATVDMVLQNFASLIGTLGVAAIFASVASGIFARFFGMSKYMAIAIASNMFMGFPINSIITNDVANAIGETPEEVTYITDAFMPKIILGGIASVSIASVIIAGVFVNLL